MSDPLLSVMLFFLYHHFVSRYQDLVGNNARTELGQHMLIDIICQVESISFILQISFMERERLFVCLGLGHRGFFVLCATIVFLIEQLFV